MASSSDRHVRRVADLEARIVAEAVRALDAQLQAIADDLRAQAKGWRDDPAASMRGRRQLADRLRKVRPGVAAVLRSRVREAVLVGGRGDVDAVSLSADELAARALREVDARTRAKARTVARLVTTARLRTDVQVRNLADRITAVASPAEAAASTVVMRAVDLASEQAAGGKARVWVTEPGCCVHCAGFAGSVARPGEPFKARLTVADRSLPWAGAGVTGPPLHSHCRCVAVPETRGLADALAKDAAAQIATGRVGYASRPAVARAAARLLRTRAPLNPAARRKAAKLARTA